MKQLGGSPVRSVMDLLAYLCRDPFSVTPEVLGKLTDDQILEGYFADWEFDDKGNRYLKRYVQGTLIPDPDTGEQGSLPPGHPGRAGRDLPSAESLGITIPMPWIRHGDKPGMRYQLMFAQTWRERGDTPEQVVERWIELQKNPKW